ncbi:MAG TPA: DNA primase [Burkholderiaceae bacterium]|nr:DNA primase [Burkholderiaceae bacterium]
MIPASFVQDLLGRIDIVELVGRTVTLKKAGINYKGLCPFHGEKSPSFIVSPSRQTYHCFGCGVHGDAIRFLCEHHGLGFVEAVTDLAQQAGMAVPEEAGSPEERAQAARRREEEATLVDVLERAAGHYRAQLKASSQAITYLRGRGVTGEIAARFALGWAPEGWRSLASAFPRYDDPQLVEAGLVIVSGDDPATQKRYDRFRERVMFPIRNAKGETIAFGGRVLDGGEPKYLNSPETPVFVKGRELYGLFEGRQGLRDKGYALVTEGYMDVVALAQLGFPNAVATLGTACTAEHVHKLLRFTEHVVFSFDGDAAGRRAAARALEAALPHATDTRTFRFLYLPPEHDPDSYIRAHGESAFEAFVRTAVPLSRQLVESAREDCDLASAEGRARMLAQARPLWRALPEGALRGQILVDLAAQGSLPPAELAALWRGRDGAGPGADSGHPDADSMRSAGPRGESRWRARQGSGSAARRPRTAPRSPEDRAVQILFGHPQYWERLSSDEQGLLHGLPAPHGTLVAWLERDYSEHGPRPWAVLSRVIAEDAAFDEDARRLADGDADPEAAFEDLQRAVDHLMLRVLEADQTRWLALDGTDPQARQRYREVSDHWREVKTRLGRPLTFPAGE